MRNFVGLGLALGLLCGLAPTAATAGAVATVQSVQGRVMMDRGAGFAALAAPTKAEPGNRVMAEAGGSAKITYSDGCTVNVAPGSVVSVGTTSPCKAPYLLGQGVGQNWGAAPLILGVTAAAVAYCISAWCRDDNGGRRAASP